jgi:hypothetical protein
LCLPRPNRKGAPYGAGLFHVLAANRVTRFNLDKIVPGGQSRNHADNLGGGIFGKKYRA